MTIKNAFEPPHTFQLYAGQVPQQFMSLVQEAMDDVMVSMENLARIVNECLVENTEWCSEIEPNGAHVESRIAMFGDVADELLKRRKVLCSVGSESQFSGAAAAVTALLDSFLAQIAEFLNRIAGLLELDGKVIEKGLHIDIMFRPDLSAESEQLRRELSLLGRGGV